MKPDKIVNLGDYLDFAEFGNMNKNLRSLRLPSWRLIVVLVPMSAKSNCPDAEMVL